MQRSYRTTCLKSQPVAGNVIWPYAIGYLALQALKITKHGSPRWPVVSRCGARRPSLIVALFIRKEYSMKSDIVIDRPKGTVFGYARRLKNQMPCNKWVMADANMKKEFSGTDGTPAFIFAWMVTNRREWASTRS